MIGGYLIALLVARNTALRRLTRAVVFVPLVMGLGVSSLLWYWLYNYDFGLVNRLLPGPGGIGQSKAEGKDSQTFLAPSILTELSDKAAVRNNEMTS